jgi:hypothetical protein
LNQLVGVRSTAGAVERLADALGEVAKFLDAAVSELKVSTSSPDREGIKERIASRLERIEVIYNVFARSIVSYRAGLADASAEVLRLVSRDLERAAVAPTSSARRATSLSAVE